MHQTGQRWRTCTQALVPLSAAPLFTMGNTFDALALASGAEVSIPYNGITINLIAQTCNQRRCVQISLHATLCWDPSRQLGASLPGDAACTSSPGAHWPRCPRGVRKQEAAGRSHVEAPAFGRVPAL